jgi:hypothetical protein
MQPPKPTGNQVNIPEPSRQVHREYNGNVSKPGAIGGSFGKSSLFFLTTRKASRPLSLNKRGHGERARNWVNQRSGWKVGRGLSFT